MATSEPGALERARAAVEGVVADFDVACSRFRQDSEICMVNASAGATVSVSPLLAEAIEASLRSAKLTGGDVDPTVGGAVISLGYDRDFDAVQEAGRLPAGTIATVPGWRAVQVDSSARTVRVTRGVNLDLGATAKALAADHAAAAASADAGCGALVSFGGDLAIAGSPPEEGWRIRVTDDHQADLTAPGQWITLRSGGLATSSITVRRWRTAEGHAHHLIDPATGHPVEGPWRTVSVTAASCVDANTASTAAIIRGARAAGWLEDLGLPSRLVSRNGQVLHVAGWPSDGDDLPRVSRPRRADHDLLGAAGQTP